MTAAEADAILRNDPDWVKQDAERKAAHHAKVAGFNRKSNRNMLPSSPTLPKRE